MPDVQLSFTEHLAELRTRLGKSLLAVAAGFAICYPQSSWLFERLQAPLWQAVEGSGIEVQVVGTGVAEAFFTRLGVCLIAAVVLALPVLLFQIWRFAAPGLEASEARFARGFVVAGTGFFLAGAAFCYSVVFPVGFPFFLSEYTAIGADPVLRIGEYLSFTSRMMFAFGVTFEMPVATYFLARAGIVTHEKMIVHGRYAVLAIFVVAAILTPPDAASQMLMAVPLLILYAASVGVARAVARPARQKQ